MIEPADLNRGAYKKDKCSMNVTDVSMTRKVRRPQAERSESMQRRLLDAATAVLKERGLAGFRTADVIERAGVSKGALLHHFPTKVSLIAAAFDRLRAATDASSRPFHPPPTLVEALSDLTAESHAFFFGEAYYVSLDIAISGARTPDLRDAIFDSVRGVRQRTEELWTDRLAVYGISHERAHDAVWLVNSIIRGLAVRALMETDHTWFRRLERLAAQMIAAHLSKLDESASGNG
jgi:AcrR family transcriptional regulator